MPSLFRPLRVSKQCLHAAKLKAILPAALALLLVLGLGACEDDDTELTALAVTPESATVDVGETVQFAAAGTYDDNSTADFTLGVLWTSQDDNVVSIDQTGLATALAGGQVTITATDGLTGVADTATMTVNAPAQPGSTTPTGPAPPPAADTLNVTVDGTPESHTNTNVGAANPIGPRVTQTRTSGPRIRSGSTRG
jgi:hypothetical protein